jgi:hypothetical protein
MPIASVAIGERPALVLEYVADEFVAFQRKMPNSRSRMSSESRNVPQ